MLDETMQEYKKALYEKFPEEKVKEKPARGRAGSDKFIPAPEIINRLNEVFGYRWSAEEVGSEEKIIQNKPYILKRVRVGVVDDNGIWFYKEQWGGHPLFLTPDPSDAYKSAFSKALAKAGAELGIALYLWGVDGEEEGAELVQEQPHLSQPQAGPQVGPLVGYTPPNTYSSVGPQLDNPDMEERKSAPTPSPSPIKGFVRPSDGASAGFSGFGTTAGLGTPARAQVTFQSGSESSSNTPNKVPIEPYQLVTLKGLANSHKVNPMVWCKEALGAGAEGIESLEQLSSEQAIQLFSYVRSLKMPGS